MNVMAQRGKLGIPYNVLLNPVANLDYHGKPTASRHEFWNGPYLTGVAMHRFVDAYLSASVDRASELVSPSHMSENTARAFAPTLIVTSSADILRDEAEELGERLQKAGRDVAVIRAHGQMHASAVIEATRSGSTPKMVMTLVTAALKQRLG